MSKKRIVVGTDATAAMDRAKKHISLVLRRSMSRYNVSQRIMAKLLQTSAANVSRFETGRGQELSFNQLFRYLAWLEPNFTILIAPEGAWTQTTAQPIDSEKLRDQIARAARI